MVDDVLDLVCLSIVSAREMMSFDENEEWGRQPICERRARLFLSLEV
jgi:hypothetical protein